MADVLGIGYLKRMDVLIDYQLLYRFFRLLLLQWLMNDAATRRNASATVPVRKKCFVRERMSSAEIVLCIT